MDNTLKINRIERYPSTLFYAPLETPIGQAIAVYTEDAALSHLFLQTTSFLDFKHAFSKPNMKPKNHHTQHPSSQLVSLSQAINPKIYKGYQSLCSQLNLYFSKKLNQFDLEIVVKGTDFQIKVWQGLLTLNYGSCCSYKILAQKIDHEKAVRALGTANGANPLPIIIPCHRVINQNGDLGGYSSGLTIKSYLLDLENIKLNLPKRKA